MAEMCGNAARCVALYAYKNGITTQSLKFETCAGVIEAQVENDERINVLMPPLKSADWKQTHSLNVETSLDVDVLNTGVPHWVIQVPSLAHTDPLRVTAQQLKQTQDFPTEGANITFWSIVGPNSIHSISYERGVNDFTLACGTGAMASAYAFRHHHKGLSLIPVQVPGGLLSVDLSGDRPHLIGPAEFVADLYCYPNLLKTP